MNTKKALREKIEVEVEVAQVQLTMLKSLASCLTEQSHCEYSRTIDAVERRVTETRSKLMELDMVQENTWEQFRDGVEATWNALQISLKDAFASFEAKNEVGQGCMQPNVLVARGSK